MRRWLFATAWRRLMFAMFVLWVLLMLGASGPFLAEGDWSGYVTFTGIILAILGLFYLVPRISNWVEYRKWDARFDHYKDPADDGGSTEGER